jgi:hypothetical protein
MKVRRVTVSAGTPRDLAQHDSGYTANGESEHTRHVARGGAPMLRSAVAPRRISKGHQLPLPQLIRETRGGIRWLECELQIEMRPARLTLLTKNLEIKRRYLATLIAEQQGDQP